MASHCWVPAIYRICAGIAMTKCEWVPCIHRTSTWRVKSTLRLRQNGHHFTDAIFKCIFLNENVWILIKFYWSLFVGSNWQFSSIVSDNGLAPFRQQAIIWTNEGSNDGIYASLCLNELNARQQYLQCIGSGDTSRAISHIYIYISITLLFFWVGQKSHLCYLYAITAITCT